MDATPVAASAPGVRRVRPGDVDSSGIPLRPDGLPVMVGGVDLMRQSPEVLAAVWDLAVHEWENAHLRVELTLDGPRYGPAPDIRGGHAWRSHLENLMDLKRRYGWRVPILRHSLAGLHSAPSGLRDVEAIKAVAIAALAAWLRAEALTVSAVRAVLAMLATLVGQAQSLDTHPPTTASHDPPGDDPPPEVADVLTLVSAPRPGPLHGVPAAA